MRWDAGFCPSQANRAKKCHLLTPVWPDRFQAREIAAFISIAVHIISGSRSFDAFTLDLFTALWMILVGDERVEPLLYRACSGPPEL